MITKSTMDCLRVTSRGVEWQDITCQYPFLGAISTQYEKDWEGYDIADFVQNHKYSVPLVSSILYLAFIYFGQKLMKDQESWKWRKTMAAWNLFLATLSLLGVVRVLPQLMYNYSTYTIEENFCDSPIGRFGSGTTGLWVYFFCFSKFPELMDTFFLVIHKKPVIFLHWYHHFTVLSYCWHSLAVRSPTGIWFCTMNFAVHSIMYFYYFLMAIKMRPKWFNPIWVTYAQISQMIVGVVVTAVACYYKNKRTDSCAIDTENNYAACIMYGSYLFLFMKFFVGRYLSSKIKATDKKTV